MTEVCLFFFYLLLLLLLLSFCLISEFNAFVTDARFLFAARSSKRGMSEKAFGTEFKAKVRPTVVKRLADQSRD